MEINDSNARYGVGVDRPTRLKVGERAHAKFFPDPPRMQCARADAGPGP